jgi:hypothetical protein
MAQTFGGGGRTCHVGGWRCARIDQRVIVALMALAALVAALSSGTRCPISRPTPEIVPQAMKAVALRALSSQ